ncbi:MAG: pyridoxal phosphate-dependent aminotransferase [Thermoproteus sp.]
MAVAVDIVEALAEINKARPAYRLDIGEPDVEPPREVLEALRQLRDAPYGPSEGLPELREAIAGLFGVDRDEVVVVAGGRHGVAALMWAFRKAGLITTRPYYPGYLEIASAFDIRLDFVDAEEGRGWTPEFSRRGVYLVNYPNNPTGAILDRGKVKELVDVADFVISDEVYRDIAFAEFVSPLKLSPNVAVVYSFSKVFSVPGFRLGAVIAPRDVARLVVRFNRATVNSAPSVLQRAIAPLVPEIPRIAARLSEIYRRRVEIAKKALGLKFVEPKGAFYIFPRLGCSGTELLRRALSRGVSVLPGEVFGSPNHARIALVLPEDRLLTALSLLNEACPGA